MHGCCLFVLVLMYFVHLDANVLVFFFLMTCYAGFSKRKKQSTHSHKRNPLNHHVWPTGSVWQCMYLHRLISVCVLLFSYYFAMFRMLPGVRLPGVWLVLLDSDQVTLLRKSLCSALLSSVSWIYKEWHICVSACHRVGLSYTLTEQKGHIRQHEARHSHKIGQGSIFLQGHAEVYTCLFSLSLTS